MSCLKVICWALIFIFKLRFPPGVSIATVLKRRYKENGSLDAFRKYQRLEFKLQKAKLDLTFLEDCKKNSVIPKFLNFKLANRNLQNSNAYLQCQRKLLNEEISIKHSRITVLSLESTEALSKLTALVSTIDAIHLRSVCDRENSTKLRHHEKVQQKKLFRLCGDASKSSTPDPDKVIFNYSSRTLTDAEKILLARGLNFSLPPRCLRFCDFLAPFEKLYGILKKEPVHAKNPTNRFNEELIKTRIKDIALTGYKTYIPPKSIFSDDEFKIIENLQKDDNIYLIKPDKGNGVVIINRTDYNSRMLNILDDNTKFERINLKKSNVYKETTRREDAVRTLINELKSNEVISEHLSKELNPIGSRPGIMYGLPKVHKPNFPLRPIISAIGTHSYKLAKFLVPLLRPFSTNTFTINDTFTFVKELRELNINTNDVIMASFDVKSLFTNIPLDETINIIINKCFASATHYHNISRDQFRDLLNLSVKNCHFLFDGVLYKQVDGVAMGSPLGPLFANIFLSFHEKSWLADCPSAFKPLFYRRYVDDCFLIFTSLDHVLPFLSYLNSKHPNIQFTHELEANSCLPFLDVKVIRSNGSFSTTVHHKSTSTGLFTNFDSFIPMLYKKGLLFSLISRYFNICSSYTLFHSEMEKFKKTFSSNGYPAALVDSCIKSFLDKIYNSRDKVQTCSKKIIYFCLPFTGHHGLQIRSQLQKLVSTAYPHISLRVVFRPSFRLSSFFPFKDKIPCELRSHVVYLYKCQCCAALYVGQTRRHIHTRISEHMGVSPLTGKKRSVSTMSGILAHCHTTKHQISPSDFKILSSGTSEADLLTRESLFISKFNPILNANIRSAPLDLF